MTKKDYILTLLSRLVWTRPLAQPLKDIVEHTTVDDEFIDGLCALLMAAVHDVADKLWQEKLQKGQAFLKSLQQKKNHDLAWLDGELDEILAKI